eukprot:44862-Prymnesium_polylepis.2
MRTPSKPVGTDRGQRVRSWTQSEHNPRARATVGDGRGSSPILASGCRAAQIRPAGADRAAIQLAPSHGRADARAGRPGRRSRPHPDAPLRQADGGENIVYARPIRA